MCEGGGQPRNHMCMPGFVVCTLCSSNNAFTSVPRPWFAERNNRVYLHSLGRDRNLIRKSRHLGRKIREMR